MSRRWLCDEIDVRRCNVPRSAALVGRRCVSDTAYRKENVHYDGPEHSTYASDMISESDAIPYFYFSCSHCTVPPANAGEQHF